MNRPTPLGRARRVLGLLNVVVLAPWIVLIPVLAVMVAAPPVAAWIFYVAALENPVAVGRAVTVLFGYGLVSVASVALWVVVALLDRVTRDLRAPLQSPGLDSR